MAIFAPVIAGRSQPLLWLWRAVLAGLMTPILALSAQRGHLLPLATLAFGLGIGLWFSQEREFDWPILVMLGGVALGLAAFGFIGPDLLRPLFLGGAIFICGYLAPELRWRLVAGPMLSRDFYGAVEGVVVEIDTSANDAVRLTLEQPILSGLDLRDTPKKLRVSLQGGQVFHQPRVGERVALTAWLMPPQGPVEPYGFDFRRMAFFDGLGAVGYARKPLVLLEPAPKDGTYWQARLRDYFSRAIRAHIAGEAGAFAAGAMTGDRSSITRATVEALRDSSLAHILAISGMNLAVLTGFVFGLIRGGLALIPPLALRLPSKKLSACAAIAVAWVYLQLSGANVATERAFIMAFVMLMAVLCDRRAISLRVAAIAGLILLASQPEALLEAGFQMSMAATVMLIAGFEFLGKRRALGGLRSALIALVASTVIGGVASAPYAAHHFNRFADYGMIANLLTVPIMGVAIMPMGVIALLLAPFGLAFLPLWVMGWACEWILAVAHGTAAFEGAVTGIAAAAPWALALTTVGALWLVLWQGRFGRGVGLGVCVMGLLLWGQGQRPALLISADGRIGALMGAEGRAVSAPSGGGFAVESWLEADGDLGGQKLAATRAGFTGPSHLRLAHFAALDWAFLNGKRGLAALERACADYDVVVINRAITAAPRGCVLIDLGLLRQSGTLAFYLEPDQTLRIVPARRGRIWEGADAKVVDIGAQLEQMFHDKVDRP